MLQDLLFLFILGLGGWMLFRPLRLPVPALLGTIVLIGGLRAAGFSLPSSPPFLIYLIQVLLGFFVGSRVTTETVRQLKSMLLPALFVVIWALFIVFFFGYILSSITFLDSYTALLSSSMGGLPEITVIALATGADVAVVILMQTFRMLATIMAFPFLLRFWIRRNKGAEKETGLESARGGGQEGGRKSGQKGSRESGWEGVGERGLKSGKEGNMEKSKGGRESGRDSGQEEKTAVPGYFSRWVPTLQRGLRELQGALQDKVRERPVVHFPSLLRSLLAFLFAAGGGTLFHLLGIPAGAMVGSTLCLVVTSLFLFPVKTPSPGVFAFMLISVGIIVSDNISPATLDTLSSGEILFPAFISTLAIFMTSLFVAHLITKTAGWDFPTSFLAAAPGGFTVMTALAITYGKDPLRVSMIHLSRLLALKTVIPLFFWFIS